MRYTIPVEGKWQTFTDADLERMERQDNKRMAAWLRGAVLRYQTNPLSHFLPHGVHWHNKPKKYAGGRVILPASTYPRPWDNDGVGFQNDWENDYVMLKAPRKTGKSLAGAVKAANLSLETHATWPCYSGQGGWLMRHRPWDGPTTGIVASFSWPNVSEVWEAYREIWPRDELGPFAPDYPRVDLGEPANGRSRNMAFGDGRPKVFIPEKSGGRMIFMCYSQMQHVWENFKAKWLHADEQIPLNLLNAFEDGSRTMGDYTPVFFTWSGFSLPDRPDTGMAGDVARIWSGKLQRGSKTVGRYNLDVPSTPDVIIGKKKKKALYDLYANPDIVRDKKTERRGLAVYFPGDEPGAGLCFGPDVWQRDLHVINPLWADDKAPRDWTKWRVIDYADKKTTCCSWFAVGPIRVPDYGSMTIAVLYRLLYESDMLVADVVERVIQMSHNTRIETEPLVDDRTQATYKTFDEVQTGEQYFADIIDPRIAEQRKESGTVLELFQRHGIRDITPAAGQKNAIQIPAFKDWLRIDWDKPHPWKRNEAGELVKGCPRLFLFDGLTQGAIDEIEAMPADENGTRIIDESFPHDFIDTGKYWASDNPVYMGNWTDAGGGGQPVDAKDDTRGTPHTGY